MRPYRTSPNQTGSPLATDAQALAGEGRREIPDATLIEWVTSADDRVVLAAIAHWHRDVRERGLAHAAFEAASARAKGEGALWTPVLDAIAAHGLWPRPGVHRPDGAYTESAEARAARLGQWLRAHGTEEDGRRLSRLFRAPVILRQVAEDTPILTAEFVDDIATAHPPALARIARNPALTPTLAQRVIRLAVSSIKAQLDVRAADLVLAEVLEVLAARHMRLTPETVEWLAAFLDRNADHGSNLPRAYLDSVLRRLGEYPHIPADCAIEYYAMLACEPAAASAMIAHVADAPIEFFRSVARTSASAMVHQALARRAGVRTDPAVRRELIGWGVPAAIRALLSDATRDEFARILVKLIEAGVSVMKTWLREDGLPRHLGLAPTDIQPLLEHDDAELRLLAITALSDTRAERTAPQAERRPI